MKKINFKSVSSTLSQKEMKNVLGGSGGGGIFRCFCGMGAVEPGEDPFFNVWAADMTAAVIKVGDRCPNGIGGCFYP